MINYKRPRIFKLYESSSVLFIKIIRYIIIILHQMITLFLKAAIFLEISTQSFNEMHAVNFYTYKSHHLIIILNPTGMFHIHICLRENETDVIATWS